MVKSCCVYTCPSLSYGGCNISFHSFPKDEERRQEWLSSIYVRQNITKNSVVCSHHFKPSCFYTANSRQLLRPDAIPTISPVAKNRKTIVLSDILFPPQSVNSEEEIVRPTISLETLLAGTLRTCTSYTEEPPRKRLTPNVKAVGVQTVCVKYQSPVEDVLKRKVKILSQRLNRREERLKKLQSRLLLYKKKCKKFEKVIQNIIKK